MFAAQKRHNKAFNIHPPGDSISQAGFTFRKLKEIMQQFAYRPKRKLGQNFLVDPNVMRKIIDVVDLNKDDNVLEIGSGIGNLTELIAPRVKQVYSVEIDRQLYPILTCRLSSFVNVNIILQDILTVDIAKLGLATAKFKVIGNLPYYITTPILFHLIDNRKFIKNIYLTMQKEVAQRLSAKPGTKEYGVLSIGVQYFCDPKIKFLVSKNVFYPKPKVDSALVALNVLNSPKVFVKDEDTFFMVVKASFNQRRKTLLNSLINNTFIKISKERVLDILGQVKISPSIRAEDLSIEDFAKISNLVSN